MCGIAGIIHSHSVEALQGIYPATHQLAHRGPNAEGFFFDTGIALGHRRLSIIDLSDSANQPFSDPSGRYTIVFNGEIYNYRDIRRNLNYAFRTQSDTEVLLAAYIQMGAKCLELLNGMFAFAIWDKEEQRLFIARDRLGVKPLYYYEDEQSFVFASEIRALLAGGWIPRKLNIQKLPGFLKFQTVHAPETLICGVRQLLPGHHLTYEKKKLTITPYWLLWQPKQRFEFDHEVSVKQKIRELFTKAVERQLVSDVPLGVFLSGGIDSSSIVAVMAKIATGPVHTFSVGFSEQKFDESDIAAKVAHRFQTEHTTIRLSADDLLHSVPDILAAVDSPSGDGPNTYVVSRATKEAGITVALSGLGGDELFSGYPVFRQYRWIVDNSWGWKLPLNLREALSTVLAHSIFPSRGQEKMAELMASTSARFGDLYPVFRRVFSKDIIRHLLPDHQHVASPLSILLNDLEPELRPFPLSGRISIGEMLSYTGDVLLKDSDQMSMVSALELRVPFFDHELVEYALQIPDRWKFQGYPKQLLVESLEGLLPKEVYQRPKMGFTLPWAQWLRKELQPLCEEKIVRLADSSIFNSDALLQYWNRFLQHDPKVIWTEIWILTVLGDWLERNEMKT